MTFYVTGPGKDFTSQEEPFFRALIISNHLLLGTVESQLKLSSNNSQQMGLH